MGNEKYPGSLMSPTAIARQENSGVPLYPVNEIYADHKFNCRGDDAASPLDSFELAKSIAAVGLLQPIIIRPCGEQPGDPPPENGFKYVIVAGYRRFQAFRVNQHPNIPAILQRGASARDNRIANLVENLKRKELNLLQEARAVQDLYDDGMPRDEIAQELGMSPGWVQVRCMILELQPEVQEEFAKGIFTVTHVRQLYTYRHRREEQLELAKGIKEARERGDKRSETVEKILQKTSKPKALQKKRRSATEVETMSEHVRSVFGLSITNRILAWVNGEITNYDVYESIKEEAHDRGIPYSIPELEL